MSAISPIESPHTLITGAPGYGIVKSASAPRSKYHHMLQEIPDLDAQALDFICLECGTELSWWQWFESRNYNRGVLCDCGELIPPGGFKRRLPRHQQLAVEEPGYFDRRWYHATRTEDWAEIIQDAEDGELLVHAGSKLSALSRADDMSRTSLNSSRPMFLYSFRLTAPDRISTTVYDDMMDEWPTRLGEGTSLWECALENDGADGLNSGFSFSHLDDIIPGAPYYNRYELPGEISLIFHAGLIDLLTVEVTVLS